ncbi:hypothetical protein NP493_718g00001 [Ridgeia piscesae]|uniref:Secreted protein n=1 Tax=Ridgeia piscesae TaxID=27915 RepID=A0AAD9KRZ0_RIDPI|nr:hypothetical protein NP493_718g00001 [Ridgeia piscesae]
MCVFCLFASMCMCMRTGILMRMQVCTYTHQEIHVYFYTRVCTYIRGCLSKSSVTVEAAWTTTILKAVSTNQAEVGHSFKHGRHTDTIVVL